MVEVINVYKQETPEMKFVGKKYLESDRKDGGFGYKWGEWFDNNWFQDLEEKVTDSWLKQLEDSDAYVGMMRWKEGEEFQYWIGMLLPLDTNIPEGFESVDIEASNIGVCWLKGKEEEIYCKEDKCAAKLDENGMKIISDKDGAYWFFERYGCPRFTSQDEEGNIVLDICHFVE
jgi:predicted transcriptional regulator YdeE